MRSATGLFYLVFLCQLISCGPATDLNTQTSTNQAFKEAKQKLRSGDAQSERILCSLGFNPFLTIIGSKAKDNDPGKSVFLQGFNGFQQTAVLRWTDTELDFFFLSPDSVAYDAPLHTHFAAVDFSRGKTDTNKIFTVKKPDTDKTRWAAERELTMQLMGLAGEYFWLRTDTGTSLRSPQYPLEEIDYLPYQAYRAATVQKEIWLWVEKDNRWQWWNPSRKMGLPKSSDRAPAKQLDLKEKSGLALWLEQDASGMFSMKLWNTRAEIAKAITLPITTDISDWDFIPAASGSKWNKLLVRNSVGWVFWEFSASGETRKQSIPETIPMQEGKFVVAGNDAFYFIRSLSAQPKSILRWEPAAKIWQKISTANCDQMQIFSGENK